MHFLDVLLIVVLQVFLDQTVFATVSHAVLAQKLTNV